MKFEKPSIEVIQIEMDSIVTVSYCENSANSGGHCTGEPYGEGQCGEDAARIC